VFYAPVLPTACTLGIDDLVNHFVVRKTKTKKATTKGKNIKNPAEISSLKGIVFDVFSHFFEGFYVDLGDVFPVVTSYTNKQTKGDGAALQQQ
jgi:hypothetical protein